MTSVAPFDHPFYFLRHGETGWNRERRIQGQIDAELSPRGVEQAARAAAVLTGEPIGRIVTSPLARARITAERVGQALGLPVVSDPALMEAHLGVHQGEFAGDWTPEFWAGRYAPEGGESFQTFRDRVIPAMRRIAAAGPDALIVSHGGLWYALASLVAFAPVLERMPNALPLHVTPGSRRWSVRLLDEPSGPTERSF